ncbi:uncharacterized protein [Argopecten irradians]|uniref:uncharacterized protein n=1 Tax=Argopecten irradians TaxID=31199 RepID=UPI00371C0DA8
MVHTSEALTTPEKDNCVGGCPDGIDINNSCRQIYLQRLESIEECKRSPTTGGTGKTVSTIDIALEKLRTDMIGLMDQDAGLMRQMLILNEKVEELKANNFCQMSKESLDSQECLCEIEEQTEKYMLESKDSVYYSDSQSDDSLFYSNESISSMKMQSEVRCSVSFDSLYNSDDFSSDEDIDNGKSTATDSFLTESNESTSCMKKTVDTIGSYDLMFEKLLDFDTKA